MTTQQDSQTSFFTNTGLGDIVVGLDGTEASRGALRWAVAVAKGSSARIRLVHGLRQATAAVRSVESETTRRVRGRRLLRSARSEIFAIDQEIVVDSLLTDEPITSFLASIADTADLIVIGGHPSGPIRDVLFGHKATRIVTGASCPVVVWRPRADETLPHAPVVVGLDDSESGSRAIDGAFWFADAFRVPLIALHVDSSKRPAPSQSTAAEPNRIEWMRSRVDAASARYPAVSVHLHRLDASAEHELRRASATANLVVVGSRGLGPMTGPVRGSVGQALVHAAHGPILVVR